MRLFPLPIIPLPFLLLLQMVFVTPNPNTIAHRSHRFGDHFKVLRLSSAKGNGGGEGMRERNERLKKLGGVEVDKEPADWTPPMAKPPPPMGRVAINEEEGFVGGADPEVWPLELRGHSWPLRIRRLDGRDGDNGMRRKMMPNWEEEEEPSVAEEYDKIGEEKGGEEVEGQGQQGQRGQGQVKINNGFDYDDDGTPPPSIGPFGATTAPPDSPKFVPPTTRPSSTTTAALLVYEKKRQNEGEGVGRMKPSSGRRTGMERIPANAQTQSRLPSSQQTPGANLVPPPPPPPPPIMADPLQMTWENCRKMESYAKMFGVPDPLAWVRNNCFFLQLYVQAPCQDINTFVASCSKYEGKRPKAKKS